MIELVRTSVFTYSPHASQVPNASGIPQRGKDLRARGMQAGVDLVDVGRVGRDRQQQRQHRAQAVADLDGAIGAADADVDVDGERVVAPGHVLQPLLDQVVVGRVDDVLLAVVRQRVRAGGPQRHALAGGEPEQPPARLVLLAPRLLVVGAATRADLDLGRDQLARDRVGEHVVGLAGVAQALERRDQPEVLRVEEGEFLLDPHRPVGGVLEEVARGGDVDH
jgi:hypothetical protein